MKEEIVILRTICCAQQSSLKDCIEQMVCRLGLDVEVRQSRNLNEILHYGVEQFPALVVKGKAYEIDSLGTEEDIELWLMNMYD